MADLATSQTLENLKAAFAGESQDFLGMRELAVDQYRVGAGLVVGLRPAQISVSAVMSCNLSSVS